MNYYTSSSENKSVIFPGDFNVDLTKYGNHYPTKLFLDSLSSNCFFLILRSQLEWNNFSKTIINNIFSNKLIENTTSSNLAATISHRLLQFIILPYNFSNLPCSKSNIFERDWSILSKKTLHWTIFLSNGFL